MADRSPPRIPFQNPYDATATFGGIAVAECSPGHRHDSQRAEQPTLSGYKDVARSLAISSKTVEFHKAGIAKKIGATAVAKVVRYAIRTGLIEA